MKTSSFFPSILTSVRYFQKGSPQQHKKNYNHNNNKKLCSSSSSSLLSSFSVSANRSSGTAAIIYGTFLLIVVTIVALPYSAQAFNDEKGILKWNPYWFSNFRYSAPSSFYISPNRVGTPYKRVSESAAGISGGGYTSGGSIYKWSPVYFSGGSSFSSPSGGGIQQPSSYYSYGSGTTGLGGGGFMYSPTRPRWSLSDYGGSRYLTRYYGGNSFIPAAVSRSGGYGGVAEPAASVIDLAGSNDLSALLGEELMNNGLGLENDTVDILDGDNSGTQHSEQQQNNRNKRSH